MEKALNNLIIGLEIESVRSYVASRYDSSSLMQSRLASANITMAVVNNQMTLVYMEDLDPYKIKEGNKYYTNLVRDLKSLEGHLKVFSKNNPNLELFFEEARKL